ADNYKALGISSQFGDYLRLGSLTSNSSTYPNPYDITLDDFDSITTICTGAGNADQANINSIYTGCGLLRGAPIRVDDGPPSLMEHGSQWSSQLHSCAATVRASIKTVTFSYNGTENNGLESLLVDKIE